MKKNRGLYITFGIIFAVILAVCVIGYVAINNLINQGVVTMNDITTTVNKVAVYFIPVLIFLGVILIGLIVVRNKGAKFNFWFKWESFLAFFVALATTINVAALGPMNALFNLNFAKLDQVSAKTVKDSEALNEEIADEGTILLKNDGDYLPIKAQNVNVFGWASTHPLYGGTGSGGAANKDSIDIYKGLQNAGFKTNDELSKFYNKYREDRPEISMMKQDWTLPEPQTKEYSDKLMKNAKDFSKTAIVVIGRSGGEGADLPKDMGEKGLTYNGNKGDFKKGDNYLQLSNSEKQMLKMVNDNFENVVVVVNASNPMELGFLNEFNHVKSALWMAGPGARGFKSLGKILNGTVNPSGKTIDTYAYSLKDSPTFNNFGAFKYKNAEFTYVNYVENIYIGYKFYESFYLNNEAGYRKAVQYPFGYGLSYTSFTQKMSPITASADGKLNFSVTVTNTGKKAGKDVVQTYYTAPYTNGGIEKSATNLLDFQKTKMLKPGESQTLLFKINQEQLASYDDKDSGAYVLDAGEYRIQIKKNSHEILDTKTVNIADKIVYSGKNKRSTDKVAAKNEFDYAKGDVNYLSRKDNFANYKQATAAPKDLELSKDIQDKATIVKNATYKKSDAKMPTTGAKNNLKLEELRGKDFNDPLWNKLLDQLTVDEMNNLITYGGYQTLAVDSVQKRHTYDFDGPSGITSFMVKDLNTTAFPAAVMIAATWNKDLANNRGEMVGKQADEIGVAGWYGPAMNLHRNAFAGRNFEYYSEDGALSGILAAQEMAGAKKHGVYGYMKHFALNDQETNRGDKLMTWSTEQAIREEYLKPFEMAVKDGGATATMSAFNFIGYKWAGANDNLLNNVLRNEWGYRGLVETDYFVGAGYMLGNIAIANGNDLMLSTNGEMGSQITHTDNPETVKNMRTASHNILYTVVNSRAYAKTNKHQSMNLPWKESVFKIDLMVGAVIVLLQVLAIFLFRRKYGKKTQPQK